MVKSKQSPGSSNSIPVYANLKDQVRLNLLNIYTLY